MINVQRTSALFILYLELKESKALHRTHQYTRVMVYAFGVHTGKALFWFFSVLGRVITKKRGYDSITPYQCRGGTLASKGVVQSALLR